MSNSSLSKPPLYLAALILLVGGGLYAAPYFIPDLPWASYADYIAFGAVGVTVLLLLLSLLLGRGKKDEGDEEDSFADLREDNAEVDIFPYPDTFSNTDATEEAVLSTEYPEVALVDSNAIVPPPGLDKREERQWIKEEKRRRAEAEKFRKKAEKEAAKAAKKAEREARKGRKNTTEILDASPEAEAWVNSVQPETSPTETAYVEDTAFFASEVTETPALPEESLSVPGFAADALSEHTPYEEFSQVETPEVVSATEDPLFREEEMSPEWLTAAYKDTTFQVPFVEETIEVTEIAAVAEDAQPSTEDQVSPAIPTVDSEYPPLAGLVNSFTTEMIALVEDAKVRAARAEGQLSGLENELESTRSELASLKEESDELKNIVSRSVPADDLMQAQEEAAKLRVMLDEVQENLEHVLSTQGTMAAAAASAERAKLMTRLMRVRSLLSTGGSDPEALSAIDDLVEEVGHLHANAPSAEVTLEDNQEDVPGENVSFQEEIVVEEVQLTEDTFAEDDSAPANEENAEEIPAAAQEDETTNTENERNA